MATEICRATAGTLKEANLLLKRAQDRKNDKIIIHPFPEEEELVVGTWVDASWANRRDGGSTGGFWIGMTTENLLQGKEEGVSLVSWRSYKCQGVVKSPGAAEAQALTTGVDETAMVRITWGLMNGK